MRQSYTFHIERNSAQLIRNVLNEVNTLSQNGVLQGLTLLTEAFVVAGIFVLLLYVEPLGALLAVGTLGVAGGGFYLLIRVPMLRWGEARQFHEGMRIQHIQQGLSGVKDVKVLGREKEFIDHYRLHTEGAAHVGHLQQAFQQFPRLALELLAVIALAVLVIVMVARDRPLAVLIPTIGLFAAAAFRVMPSVNRILTAVQVVRFSMPVVDVLYTELVGLAENQEPPASPTAPLPFNDSLTLENVRFWYANCENPAVDGVSLTIRAGQTVGFIGGSGAGKSTLVDLMLALLKPTSGVIRVDGVDVRTNVPGWQGQIGYVPQAIYLTDDSLIRNIAFGLADTEIDEAAVWRAARLAQIDGFIRELPLGMQTRVGERGVRLSGGQIQRIGIARALYHDPAVLVLDEATSSLDTGTEHGVMEAVAALRGRKTVIIVTHRLSTVEQCDRLFRIDQGRVIDEGRPTAVLPALAAQTR
jgi:ABC-type multidrug transport system fused ATPase/permease subunit